MKTGYKMKQTGQKEQDMLADDLCRVKQTVNSGEGKTGISIYSELWCYWLSKKNRMLPYKAMFKVVGWLYC